MDFKAFMLPEIKEYKDEIITFKGVDTYKDKNGEPIPIKFKKIGRKEWRKIREEFTTKKPALDKKGNNIISGGKIVYAEDVDNEAFTDTIITRTIVEPNLHAKELLDYYGAYSAVELLNIMFKGEDYDYLDRCCAQAAGMIDIDPEEVISEVKN